MPKTVEERFWQKVDKNGPVPSSCPELGPCWIWKGAHDYEGYGRFRIGAVGSRVMRAHRVACDFVNGPDYLNGSLGCHLCDNTGCVIPDHVFPGTDATNAMDKVFKGRATTKKNLLSHWHHSVAHP